MPSGEHSISSEEFLADKLDHYLEVHKDLYFPHKHSFYHLVFFTKGDGGHSIDFVNFQVTPGQLYFMSPGQVHTWDFQQGVDGYIINFSENYIGQFLNKARYVDQFTFFSGIVSDQVLQVPIQEQEVLKQLFELIIKESKEAKAFSNDMIRGALIQLFILVSRGTSLQSSGEANNYNSTLFRNFKKLIDLHYKTNRLTKEFAALLYITPNHLNALTKDIVGRSAGELIRERIILEAKRLLINTEITITEISNELEFADNSYFTKFFKKYAGITPEVFKRQFGTKTTIYDKQT